MNKRAQEDANHVVGDIISEALQTKGLKQSELCELTGIAKPMLNDVIKGRRALTAEMAVLIESAIGMSADMLLSIQIKYDLDRAYNNEKIILQLKYMSEWEQMKRYISIPVLKKMELPNATVAEKVKTAMSICRVSDILEFEHLTKQEEEQAYFKKSSKLNIDKAALFTWKNYCMYKALSVPISFNFHREQLDELEAEIKVILAENVNTYFRVKQALENKGIRLMYIEKVGSLPVDGLSFWIDDNPTIVLTRRLLNIDNFAFSIMHEVGHIKLHLTQDSQALINLDGKDLDEIETEANQYARDVFVPQCEWDAFMSKIANCNPYAVHIPIKREAERLNINPQILFGRYMHDTGLYRLRRAFPTEVN
jgi:HTH-type transcriptional regulator / antitoxin HigA